MSTLGPGLHLPFILGGPDGDGTSSPTAVTPSPAAQRILDRLAHLYIDPESDDLLKRLVMGLCNGLERAHIVAYGTDTCPAERVLTDPLLCPDWALPHAALYTGGTMPTQRADETPTEYIARARANVIAPQVLPGTTQAAAAAGRPLLTGSKSIQIFERYQGNPWRTLFITLPSETPDVDAFRAAVNDPSVVLGGARIETGITGGQTWDDLILTPWDDLPTWDTLAGGPV